MRSLAEFIDGWGTQMTSLGQAKDACWLLAQRMCPRAVSGTELNCDADSWRLGPKPASLIQAFFEKSLVGSRRGLDPPSLHQTPVDIRPPLIMPDSVQLLSPMSSWPFPVRGKYHPGMSVRHLRPSNMCLAPISAHHPWSHHHGDHFRFRARYHACVD